GHRGEIVGRVPARWVAFRNDVEQALLEGFEHHAGVAIELDTDLVVVVESAPDWQILSPIIWVALVDDALRRLDLDRDIRARAHDRRQRRLVEFVRIDRMLW